MRTMETGRRMEGKTMEHRNKGDVSVLHALPQSSKIPNGDLCRVADSSMLIPSAAAEKRFPGTRGQDHILHADPVQHLSGTAGVHAFGEV